MIKVVNEESATKNNFSGIKKPKGSKSLLKFKKQIKKIALYRHRIPQSSLFMDLIFFFFETWLIK